MKIEYLRPEDLKPYRKNAKKHPEEQVQHIANSIEQFGFRQPIVVDADNVVVIGHGRLLAAKKLGMESVPVVRADDLTEAQIKALRLADNKTNESDWDFDFLKDELAGLETDFDMSDFGFDDDLKIIETGADAGEIEDKTNDSVAVTIRFQNVRLWRNHEQELRNIIDEIEGASVSVGGCDENNQRQL